jgi:protein-tyrosine phosphatase
MISKLFGFKKEEKKHHRTKSDSSVADFSFLRTDMHSHLIPGIDDGPKTVEDSVLLVEKLIGLGYERFITTPHIKFDHYPNNQQTINNGFKILTQALNAKGIEVPIMFAAEYYVDEHFLKLLETEKLLTITENQILIEISFLFEPTRFNDILFKIQTSGYRPILAHPERYTYYHRKYEMYKELKNRGCLFQLNTISLTGYYSQNIKEIAERLLDDGLIDYCGSDTHHIKHIETQEKILNSSKIFRLKKDNFLNSQLQF